MQLVERRIGLLFAVFLARARRSARPRPPGSASSRPARSSAPRSTQQEADIEIPARRGSIADANGIDLARLRAGVGHRRHAVPDRRRDEGRRPARAADRRARGRAAAQAREPRRPSSTSRAACRPRRPTAPTSSRSQGIEFIPRYTRDYPRDWIGLAAARQHRHRRAGPRRARVHARQAAARHRRRAPAGQGRDGQPDRDARHEAGRARRRRPPHARRQPPGPRRGGAQRGRRDVEAQGRDRDRDGPATAARSSRSPTGRA